MQFENKVMSSIPSTSRHNSSEEMLQRLRAMFPDINCEYLKSFCPAEWAPGPDLEVQFSNIVERILENEANWVFDVNMDNVAVDVSVDDSMILNIDETYEYLTGIFPNADPFYLRRAAETFATENDVKNFVEDKLQRNDYPTRDQYFAKIKVTEEQQRYTNNFDVEQFLALFPDPVAHFEDATRKCQYSIFASEFLKTEFSQIRATTINRIYRSSKYNMSITARELRATTDFITKPRRGRHILSENVVFLQEMAFVRHYELIRRHMEAVKQKEEEEFNALKANGGFWTCQCCYDEECMPSKCSTCDNGHVFCNSCVVKGTDTKLGDGETHIPCFVNCGSEFSIKTLQKVLPSAKFSILLQKRQAAEVLSAGLEGLVSCPFCPFASIPPEGDKVFKCLNPECMKESCIKCKEPNHVPLECGQEKKKDKARKYIEEKMTQALTRTCYKCKKVFIKEEGCNLMTCPCKAKMCFICNSPVDGYQHFEGQGSNAGNLCPLWTNNEQLNAEAVRRVEEAARREILQQDPTLEINTAGLAPALPPPVQGPVPGPGQNVPNIENIANMLAAGVLGNPGTGYFGLL